VTDRFGAIIRGDTTRKHISLVFTGDEYADGGEQIRQVLRSEDVKATFFLTGRFYSNPQLKRLIGELIKDGHYLGAHSDAHLLYCDWAKRDSMLVSNEQFKRDLQGNYERMAQFGIKKSDALYFLPPYEWYNSTIVKWTKDEGGKLINFSPGTRSAADYTYPELGSGYRTSEEIYKSITSLEEKDPNGLNGFILLVHIGTDPRRKDKFYFKLKGLIRELKSRGYHFERIDELLKE
jgi:endoglucanase